MRLLQRSLFKFGPCVLVAFADLSARGHEPLAVRLLGAVVAGVILQFFISMLVLTVHHFEVRLWNVPVETVPSGHQPYMTAVSAAAIAVLFSQCSQHSTQLAVERCIRDYQPSAYDSGTPLGVYRSCR